MILADDQGWSDLDSSIDPTLPEAGSSYFHTPNLDRLARDGMRFTSGYASAPLCTPTRRSIQFGMTPARQRGTDFISDFHPKGHLSIAQALEQVSPLYRCAHFGKWGEVMSGKSYSDKNPEASPTRVGYDESDGVTGNETGTSYHHVYQKEDYPRNWTCEPDDDPKRTFSVTQRTIGFMERQVRDKHPFFVQASYYAIHTAYQARKETIAKYAGKGDPPRQVKAGIAPMLEDLDTAIGQLLDTVDRLGIADNTYVFFTSDNGGERGPNFLPMNSALPPRNHPLRLYKQFLYEGGIRVPFIVRGPGVEANSISREPVVQYDLLPTFYDLAGGKKPLPADIDGGSLRPLLAGDGNATVTRALPGLVFHRPGLEELSHSAIRVGDLKLVVRWARPWEPSSRELYDLGKDIGERNSLAASMPEKTDELYGLLLSYLKSVDAEPPPIVTGRASAETLLAAPESAAPPAAKGSPSAADSAAPQAGGSAPAATGAPSPPGGAAPAAVADLRSSSRPEWRVPRLTATPVIDGRLSEWPLDDARQTMVLPATGGGPSSQTWLGYDAAALYLATRNPVDNAAELAAVRKPRDNYDRVLLAIQNPSDTEAGPVLTLLGYPDGQFRNPDFAGAPAQDNIRLESATTYRAEIAGNQWTCEWRIPFAALGIDPKTTPKVRFNIVVKKTQPKVSCIWQITGGSAWELDKAGVLAFDQ